MRVVQEGGKFSKGSVECGDHLQSAGEVSMESREKVYLLRKIEEDPRFEGFGSRELSVLTEALPEGRRSRDWQVKRLAPTWKPLQVKGRVRLFNDFPCVSGYPAFSAKAVEALRDMLEPNGELLPLETSVGTYFAYNPTSVKDALDRKNSEINWLKEPISIFRVDHYEFLADQLSGLTIFKIPEHTMHIYVTQAFVDRAVQHNLMGFDFRLVWPLPKDVSWRDLAAAKFRDRMQEGLPKGEWLTGNTVVIRLALSGKESSAFERQHVDRLIEELNAILVKPQEKSPVIGNLEGSDFGVKGECRLFLTCPDADGLVNELRPWRKMLDWPGRVAVVKRYGEYFDPDAKEELVEF